LAIVIGQFPLELHLYEYWLLAVAVRVAAGLEEDGLALVVVVEQL
jgi:hypothetical protein